jgi:hypothetical protein
MRAGTRLVSLLLVVLPGHALAAPAAVCRVIPDVAGDAAYHPLGPLSDVPALPGTVDDDLLSADVASDGRRLTAVWRMRRAGGSDAAAPLGRYYTLVFDVRGKGSWFLSARAFPTGTQYVYGDFVQQTRVHSYPRVLGTARGRIDPARGVVTVDAPASTIAGGLRRGTSLLTLRAGAGRLVGQGVVASRQVAGQDVPLSGIGLGFDDASGNKYVVGTRSCVRPGL